MSCELGRFQTGLNVTRNQRTLYKTWTVCGAIAAAICAWSIAVLVDSRGLAAQGAPPNVAQGTDGLGAPLPPEGAKPQPEKLKLPPGFSVAIWAENVRGPRTMTLASDGTVFVGTWQAGNVYALADRNNDQRADSVITIASGLTMPNGVAFEDGTLYVAEVNRILRFDNVLASVKPAMAPLTPTVVFDRLPSERHHGWKYLRMGPDGYLYVPVGAPCNICDREQPFASILRVRPDGTGLETFARGIRNSVGFTWHPDTGALWFTDNGRDMLGDDQPNDELNVAPKAGLHFGYPHCHEGTIADPEFGKNRSCGEFQGPAQKMGPHVAPLGLAFYQGAMFPSEYRKQLFIAQHGSWNRTPASGHTGYRIMVAKVSGSQVVGYDVFAQGWLEQGRQAWGRPVDILELPDGSLLVSDDRAHAIYRISYRR
ncbi:MAG: sorbosone dehydrogenase family protein [Acidimicrobiia bacterium]|nr:sorbosone dehydrogenase family protein [Acidimicrobiia bacterium]